MEFQQVLGERDVVVVAGAEVGLVAAVAPRAGLPSTLPHLQQASIAATTALAIGKACVHKWPGACETPFALWMPTTPGLPTLANVRMAASPTFFYIV